MTDHILHLRDLQPKDWATILFVVALMLIAIAKSAFENRFNDYIKLIISDKYLKVYRDNSHLMSGFTISLFLVQLISFSFFAQLILAGFGLVEKTNWIVFIQIFTMVSVFILGKVLIEKIIATSFRIEEFTEQFNLQKVSYRTYLGLIILPIDIILFYNEKPSHNLLFLLIAVFLAINLLTYLISLKNYQNLLFSKMFYFILYLCALEIAPYYFMYHWFMKL